MSGSLGAPEFGATMAESTRRRGLIFLSVAVCAMGMSHAVEFGVSGNFMNDVLDITGPQRGVVEGLRESCGIFALLVLAVLAGLAEPLIGAAMLVIYAVGLGSYFLVPDFTWLIVASMVWSQGLHVWMPLPNSMALAMAEPGRAGRRIGQLRAAGSAGVIAGLAGAYGLNYWGVAMRPMYLVAGGVAIVAAMVCLGIPRRIKTPGPRMVFRRKYKLYYALNFLEGWRKQIFMCFAGYLLIRKYDTPLETMLLLRIAVQVIGLVAAPRVGRLIDRVGERRVLMFYFASLVLFFIGYALVDNVAVLMVLFVIDNAFFVFAMALTTYVRHIAPESEYTGTLSMGVAMNHVSSVAMPLIGAVLLAKLGDQWPFLLGALGAAISVAVAWRIPAHHRAVEDA